MAQSDKPRLLVMTDIGGDPDDEQSLVRLLVHADEFAIEGIVPDLWEKHEGRFGPLTPESQLDVVRDALGRYAAVVDNLRSHSPGFPSPEHLESVLKRGATGIPHPGKEGERVDISGIVGAENDCEGSEWIIACVDRDDPRPLDICIWGGSATLAQALWRVRESRGAGELQAFVGKIRVHAIGDQDDTGPWIRDNFPGLFYILDMARSGDKLQSCYRGMFLGGDESLTSREWIDTNVRVDHGPLGEWYPTKTWTASNPHGCLKEGDTPSWFYFYRNGLNIPADPRAGGWGGRYERVDGFWQDTEDTVNGETAHRSTVWRWRPAFQNEFAARMDWCVQSPGQANHKPIAAINGDASRSPLSLSVKPGATIELDAAESRDPDGDTLHYRWGVYPEAGTFQGSAPLSTPAGPQTTLSIPAQASGTTIHVILEVTDTGTPALTAYRRVVVRVE